MYNSMVENCDARKQNTDLFCIAEACKNKLQITS